tara:strand:- start:29552 stop:30058 length:507 start_codon:yes stop_codon:yes gene_type:complete
MSYGLMNWWWGENPEWKFLENLKITKVANEGDGGTADLSVSASLGNDSVGFDNRMVGKSLEWLSINDWMGENLIPESMIAPFQKHPCLIFYGDLGFSKAVKKISNPTRIRVPSYLHMTEKEFLKAFHFSDSDGWWILKDMNLNQAIVETLKKNSPEQYQKFQDYEVKA